MSSFTCPYLVGEDCRRLDVACDPGIKGCILRGKVRFAENPEKDPSPDEVARTKRRVEKRRPHSEGSTD